MNMMARTTLLSTTGKVGKRTLLSLTVAGVVMAGACSPRIDVHGNLPEEDTISEIRPGESSRTQVVNLLGTPSTISTFQDDVWYYIGQRNEQLAFFRPEALERKVLKVQFGTNDIVSDTQLYTLAEGQEIELVERETPTEGQDITILQQLLGNIGRFNAGGGESGRGNTGPTTGTPGAPGGSGDSGGIF